MSLIREFVYHRHQVNLPTYFSQPLYYHIDNIGNFYGRQRFSTYFFRHWKDILKKGSPKRVCIRKIIYMFNGSRAKISLIIVINCQDNLKKGAKLKKKLFGIARQKNIGRYMHLVSHGHSNIKNRCWLMLIILRTANLN